MDIPDEILDRFGFSKQDYRQEVKIKSLSCPAARESWLIRKVIAQNKRHFSRCGRTPEIDNPPLPIHLLKANSIKLSYVGEDKMNMEMDIDKALVTLREEYPEPIVSAALGEISISQAAKEMGIRKSDALALAQEGYALLKSLLQDYLKDEG